jgi:hypothetical protein
LLIRLSSGQKKIWNNEFDSARSFLATVQKTALDCALDKDPDIVSACVKYKTKIGEQLCRNLSDSVEVRLIRADRWIAGRNYTRAMDILKEAITLSVSLSECHYPVQPLLDTISKYTQAATYQQKLADASGHAATGAYDLVISDLENASVIFRENQLSKQGLKLVSVMEFLEERGNPLLTERGVSYYYLKADYQASFSLMNLLKLQRYPERSVANLQNQLGRRLATEDYLKNPADSCTVKIAAYTGSQDWFSVFSAAYNDEWNRLVKKNGKK